MGQLHPDIELPRMGLEDGSLESDPESESVWGRERASWADGHTINAGLPDVLPLWLNQMGRRISATPSVVRSGKPRGGHARVNWTSTLRRWAKLGHADANLTWIRHVRGPGRLVVLWDVSGSMGNYVGWYFPWLYRLVSQYRDVQVFAFGTGVQNVTSYLAQDYGDAVKDLYGKTALWGSGTAIGQAFQDWNRQYGVGLLGSKTVVIVISDGWDVGPPEPLDQALRTIAQRTRRIIWINPLMVTQGFEPRTRALRVVLQYTDDMMAGATSRDLLQLGWQLGYG